MAELGSAAGGLNAPLVMLTFLQQTGCGSPDLQEELASLDRELRRTGKKQINQTVIASYEDGDLQTDGHNCISVRGLFADLEPRVELPVSQAEQAALREVAVGLIEIADQLERNIMARAVDNLTNKLSRYPLQSWKAHLTAEVEWVLKHGLSAGLQNLPQERVIVALTLTLVKGVCERAPRLLRNLFSTALQYINPGTPR